jgi:sugar phosphate isomerase/epimerase
MRIGLSIWHDILGIFEKTPELLNALFNDAELRDIEVHPNDSDEFKTFLFEMAKRFRLRYSVHCTHSYYNPKVNLCSNKPEIMENSDLCLKEAIKYAQELNAQYIIIHPDALKDVPKQEALNILESHIRNNLGLLDKSQKILIENMPGEEFALSTPSEFIEFLKRFDGRVAACWDVGHEIHRFREQNFEFPKLLKEKIKEIHLSGVVNFCDHYPLTKGDLNLHEFAENLREIDYKGAVIFEMPSKNTSDILDIIESKNEIDRFMKK